MSRTVSFKQLSAAFVREHAEAVVAALCTEPSFVCAKERASGMGVSLCFSLFGTYTDEKRYTYRLPEGEDDIPYGMQLDVVAEVVRDGYVLFVTDKEGHPIQLSTSFTVLRTADTLFGKKAQLFDLPDIDAEQTVAMLEDFLDRLQEQDGVASAVLTGDACPKLPAGPYGMTDSAQAQGEQEVVELLGGPFTGTFGNDGSVYFSFAAFMPYLYLLEGRSFGFFAPHGVSVIGEDAWQTLACDVRDLCGLLPGQVSFTDALTEMDIFSPMPSAAAERCLCELTLRRTKDFAASAMAFLDWGAQKIKECGCISVLWP